MPGRVSAASFLSEPPPLDPGPATSCPWTPPQLLGFAHHLPPSGAPRGWAGAAAGRRRQAGGHGGPGGLGPDGDAPPTAGGSHSPHHSQHCGDGLPRPREHWGQALRRTPSRHRQQQRRRHARWPCPGSPQQLSATVPCSPARAQRRERTGPGGRCWEARWLAGWGGHRRLPFRAGGRRRRAEKALEGPPVPLGGLHCLCLSSACGCSAPGPQLGNWPRWGVLGGPPP